MFSFSIRFPNHVCFFYWILLQLILLAVVCRSKGCEVSHPHLLQKQPVIFCCSVKFDIAIIACQQLCFLGHICH